VHQRHLELARLARANQFSGNWHHALDALGKRRPRRKQTLDECITEANVYIETTEKRLQYLKDIRSHAQLLRGAVESYTSLVGRSGENAPADISERVEKDFTSGMDNDTSRLAALELRGLLRARCLGNLTGALQDFIDLQRQAQQSFCTRGEARALRLQSEILFRQSAGENARILIGARRNLNRAYKLFDDGRTLSGPDWLEKAQNREAYGTVQATLSAITGTSDQRATQAFGDALRYYQLSGLSTEVDVKRIGELMGTPAPETARPSLVCRLVFRLCGKLQSP
jgi:hypothetical protein